jgi:hypothetical protein
MITKRSASISCGRALFKVGAKTHFFGVFLLPTPAFFGKSAQSLKRASIPMNFQNIFSARQFSDAWLIVWLHRLLALAAIFPLLSEPAAAQSSTGSFRWTIQAGGKRFQCRPVCRS